jgi:hypothetical protein
MTMTPNFFYDFVSGRCLDYVIKLWAKNFELFFCNTDSLMIPNFVDLDGTTSELAYFANLNKVQLTTTETNENFDSLF